MRKLRHVDANIAASDGAALPADLVAALRPHRWVRQPSSPSYAPSRHIFLPPLQGQLEVILVIKKPFNYVKTP